MYETEMPETAKKHSFTETVASVPGTIDAGLPTLDKRMDRYFDAHIKDIVEEWGLVTLTTFEHLERRLDAVSSDINALEKGRAVLEQRAHAIDAALREMEAGEEEEK
jgi:hypothetical protein